MPQMQSFVFTTPDGAEFAIDASDENQARKAWDSYQKQNYIGKETADGVPKGMVFDPNSGAMVDAGAMAKKMDMGASGLMASPARGLPFVGSWLDEMFGKAASSDKPYDSPEVNQELFNQVAQQTDEQYPKTSTGLKIGGALSTIPIGIGVATKAAALPGARSVVGAAGNMGLAGDMALGGTVLGGAGALDGAVRGYGEGNTPEERAANAKKEATVSGLLGAGVGVIAPAVGAGVGAGYKAIKDSKVVNDALKQLGMSRTSAERIGSALSADEVMAGRGGRRMQVAGKNAMLADAGPATANLLDTSVNLSEKGSKIAGSAISSRANATNSDLGRTFDAVMGPVTGFRSGMKRIAQMSAPGRKKLYDVAMSRPIDYAKPAGREIEDILHNRVDPDTLRAAIKEANAAMRADGLVNKQIMANIDDFGKVTYQEMPNIQQVDALKRALQDIGERGTDPITGKMTDAARRAKSQAADLRDAATSAVPEYKLALAAGQSKILDEKGLQFGRKLLSKSTSMEDVKEFVKSSPVSAQQQAFAGLRSQIDGLQASVKSIASDADGQQAREAMAAWKEMSSRANREKLAELLGPTNSKILFRQLDQTGKALELKASVAVNSKTAQRLTTKESVDTANNSGVVSALRRGEIVGTPKAILQKMTGGRSVDDAARNEQTFEEISKILTGPRGPDAIRAYQQILHAYKVGNINAAEAERMAEQWSKGVAVGSYGTTEQLIAPRQ